MPKALDADDSAISRNREVKARRASQVEQKRGRGKKRGREGERGTKEEKEEKRGHVLTGGKAREMSSLSSRPSSFTNSTSYSMSSAWDLWLTPTISLSLIIEAESPIASVTRFVSQWALYFRPYLLKQALEYELEQRPDQEVVSASTLRVVDYSYFRQKALDVSFLTSQPLLTGT